MAEIGREHLDRLEWRRYYPAWLGLNDCDESERWWVELRAIPSHRATVRAQFAAYEAKRSGDDVDFVSLYLARFVRGPFNLTANGKPVESIATLLDVTDARDLVEEIEAELERLQTLEPDEKKDSGSPSGGDTTSPDGDGQKAESQAQAPAEDASETRTPPPAPAYTTRSVDVPSESAAPSPSDGGA